MPAEELRNQFAEINKRFDGDYIQKCPSRR